MEKWNKPVLDFLGATDVRKFPIKTGSGVGAGGLSLMSSLSLSIDQPLADMFFCQKGTLGSRSGALPCSWPAQRRRGLRGCHTLSRVNTVWLKQSKKPNAFRKNTNTVFLVKFIKPILYRCEIQSFIAVLTSLQVFIPSPQSCWLHFHLRSEQSAVLTIRSGKCIPDTLQHRTRVVRLVTSLGGSGDKKDCAVKYWLLEAWFNNLWGPQGYIYIHYEYLHTLQPVEMVELHQPTSEPYRTVGIRAISVSLYQSQPC